jgi:signal transduction histidine kinase
VSVSGWSLARRLAVRLAAVLVVAIGLAAVAVGWRAIVTARALDDTALQAQARAIAGYLTTAPDGTPRLDLPAALADAFRLRPDGSTYLVAGTDGRVRVASDAADAALLLPYLPPADGLFRVPAGAAHPRGLVGYVLRSGPWRIAVAQGSEQAEVLARSLLAEFFSTGLVLLVAIGGAAALVGVWTVRDGLGPLRRASAAAARVDPAQPGLRLPDTDLPAEVAPLVSAVNQALERLEVALGVQRRFVGDAAHTLRTPLAVLTARLDAMSPGADTDSLRRDTDRMTRLIEQMLQMARLDGPALDVSRPVTLRAVAVEAISALAPLALRRGVELALLEVGTPGPLHGNHAALVIALTNLIENALIHAPAGSIVEIELALPARIRVLDRGPGVPESERVVIFERFRRGHGSALGGAGLGLAIVAGIAAAHRGTARVSARADGGAAFELALGNPPS